MVSFQFVIKEGENIIAQATHELTNSPQLKQLMEQTLPGLEETIASLLMKAEATVSEEVSHIEGH